MSSQATKCKETVRVPPLHCRQKGESGSSDRSFFLDSKITTDCDCSLEIKKCLPLGRKAMTNLDSILKSTDITLQKKAHIAKVMVFQVLMYGYKSWAINKARFQRMGVFQLWWWRLLRVFCTVRRSSQPILREISSEYSLKGLMLNLYYFGHLMQRGDSLKKNLMLGKIESRK